MSCNNNLIYQSYKNQTENINFIKNNIKEHYEHWQDNNNHSFQWWLEDTKRRYLMNKFINPFKNNIIAINELLVEIRRDKIKKILDGK